MRRFITALLLFLLLSISSPFMAADYPSKPITLLIGFEQGGTLFTQAEVLAEVLSETLNQPVNIETRSGLGGGIAAAMLANSSKQGYILLFTPSFPITDYPTRLQASYEIDDFTYISSVSADQHAFVTSQFAPFSDWAEFLEYARRQNEILYASQNLTDRLIIQAIANQEGFKVRIVPVSGGAGMTPLVLAGDVDLAFSGGTHSRFTDSGEMRVLAATGGNRLKHYPDVPTLYDLGYSVGMQSVRLLAGPKDLPLDQVDRLSRAVEQAVQDPRFLYVTEEVIRQPIMTLKGDRLKVFLDLQQRQLMRLISNQD